MSPRQPTGKPPGRRHAADQDAVRRVVRAARFTEAEAEALDASGVPLHDLAMDGLAVHREREDS